MDPDYDQIQIERVGPDYDQIERVDEEKVKTFSFNFSHIFLVSERVELLVLILSAFSLVTWIAQ